MEIDKTTLYDLAIFAHKEEDSIFAKFNFCTTINGSIQLKNMLAQPLSTIALVQVQQQTIQLFIQTKTQWPAQITNGTLMVVEKLFVANIDEIPSNNNAVNTLQYKIINGADYALVKYSAQHCFDFIKGMQAWCQLFSTHQPTGHLQQILNNTANALNIPQFNVTQKYNTAKDVPTGQLLALAHFFRYRYKQTIIQLINYFAQLDAWCSVAQATLQYNLIFPQFINSTTPTIHLQNLQHLMLPNAVAYPVSLNKNKNFLFLTGANMAGKSTFIRSVGCAVYLAHLGFAIPVTQATLTFFNGILSNINVTDNLNKGESYFYNEVKRIKATIEKINDNKNWLILIDELFKGTNIQDAMHCSIAVVSGLQKVQQSLFILSSHLYEISEDIKQYPNIDFKYFETFVENAQLRFNYQLKNGVSNDRLGYLILEKEGVTDLLKKL
jgi:DNA mismatch repair protein MutS